MNFQLLSGYGHGDGVDYGDGNGDGCGYGESDGYGDCEGESDGHGGGVSYSYSDGDGYGYGYDRGSGYGNGYGDSLCGFTINNSIPVTVPIRPVIPLELEDIMRAMSLFRPLTQSP